jgi:hypothetical protein
VAISLIGIHELDQILRLYTHCASKPNAGEFSTLYEGIHKREGYLQEVGHLLGSKEPDPEFGLVQVGAVMGGICTASHSVTSRECMISACGRRYSSCCNVCAPREGTFPHVGHLKIWLLDATMDMGL